MRSKALSDVAMLIASSPYEDRILLRKLYGTWMPLGRANAAYAEKLYPYLGPTSQAARKAYSRDGLDVARNRRSSVTASYKDDGNTAGARSVTGPYKYISIRESHTPLIRYQPKGPGQKSRIALIDAANIAGARALIEAALGEPAAFELIMGEEQTEAALRG